MAGYMAVCTVLVVLIGRRIQFRKSEYLPAAAQFFFGGLLSPFLVFFFKSAAGPGSMLFLFLLILLLVGNEFLEKRFSNTTVSFAMFVLCCGMFFVIVMPIAVRRMGLAVFLLGLAASSAVCMGVWRLIRNSGVSLKPVAAIYGILAILYITNVIPPVPLSMKHLGVYHSVTHINGEYVCSMEKPRWYEFFKNSETTFRYRPGDRAYCFTSVFAPTQLRETVRHRWYYKAPGSFRYREVASIPYTLSGGRDEGYRGYTCTRQLAPGKWKVAVTAADGKTIGIARFQVVQDNEIPEMVEIHR
jgi:hypothetical protein